MTTIARGLEGVVVTETRLSDVDGERGRLIIGGVPVEELAPQARFEEVLFLLWHDRFPSADEYQELRDGAGGAASLSRRRPWRSCVRRRARRVPCMDALRMGVATLSASDAPAGDDGRALRLRDAIGLVARFPTIVATYARLRQGQEPIAPTRRSGTRRELPLHAHRHRAAHRSRARAGNLSEYRRRSRHERVDLHRARHRQHALRHGVGAGRCGGCVEGAAARRCARTGARHGLRDSGACGTERTQHRRGSRAVDPRAPSPTVGASWGSGIASTKSAIHAPRCSAPPPPACSTGPATPVCTRMHCASKKSCCASCTR